MTDAAPEPDAAREAENAHRARVRAWVAEFRAARGRAPRVLHVGNIANNAYNNAWLFNAEGVEADVLCHSYFHIMACPEWEDADFEGEIGHQSFPCWAAADLRGFRRPRWFSQGRWRLAVDYLIARRSSRPRLAALLWRLMTIDNTLIALTAEGVEPRPEPGWRTLQVVAGVIKPLARATARIAAVFAKASHRARGIARRAVRGGPAAAPSWTESLRRLFAERFPDRDDIGPDFACYTCGLPRMARLFARYDLVQAYSTDPIWPLLAGVPYVAFEHGTLRHIPFENTRTGRVCALGYHLAPAVVVTNADCLENARGLCTGSIRFVNHPFDEDHALRDTAAPPARDRLERELDADFIVFFPTRHDWVEGTGTADKANDVFLRAAADARARGVRVGLVCCAWGKNVEQSKALIAELGLSPHVRWERPMGTVRFERSVRDADLVADQFKLGAFGGVFFKAMAAGRAIISYLDNEAVRDRYGEPVPLINARTRAEIADALVAADRDRGTLRELGSRGRAWMKAHHSGAETMARQVELYRSLIGPEPRPDDAPPAPTTTPATAPTTAPTTVAATAPPTMPATSPPPAVHALNPE